MDWTSLGLSLVKAGAPVIASLFLGPEAGPLVSIVLDKLGGALGVPATPDAVTTAIASDPDAAAKVQGVEAAHAGLIQAYLADVQNARSTEVEYVKAGSFIAAVPGIWTIMVVGAFITVMAVLLGRAFTYTTEQLSLLNILLGVLVGEVARCGNFWMGSTQAGRLRGDQAIDFAHKSSKPPPALPAKRR